MYEFDENPFAAVRMTVVGPRMDKADVMSTRTFANASGGEAHALPVEPVDGGGQIVDPKPDMIERGLVDSWLSARVKRLHQVDLDREPAETDASDILVDVLGFAAEGCFKRETKKVTPKMMQALLVGAPNRNLLHAEHLKRTFLSHRAAI